jgi:hypothetical protein
VFGLNRPNKIEAISGDMSYSKNGLIQIGGVDRRDAASLAETSLHEIIHQNIDHLDLKDYLDGKESSLGSIPITVARDLDGINFEAKLDIKRTLDNAYGNDEAFKLIVADYAKNPVLTFIDELATIRIVEKLTGFRNLEYGHMFENLTDALTGGKESQGSFLRAVADIYADKFIVSKGLKPISLDELAKAVEANISKASVQTESVMDGVVNKIAPNQPQGIVESEGGGQVVEQKGTLGKIAEAASTTRGIQGVDESVGEETRGELPVKVPFRIEDIRQAEILAEGRNSLESKGERAGNISERQYSLGRSLINTEGKTTSEGMLGSREGIKSESRINDEGISKGEANIVTEGRTVIGEEGIVEGRTYQPPYTPPYQPPYQPPYRPPFTSPPPPIQEKSTPPVLVKTSLSPSPEEKRRDAFAGATAWKQGFGYWAIKYPYTRKSDIAFFRKPPEGAEIVSGAGAAYRSIKLMTGKAPPKDLLIPLGIMTIRIRNPEAKAGKKGAIAYKMNKAAKRGKKTGSVRIVA